MKRAELRAQGKDDVPTKRAPVVRQGVNTVTSLVEQKKALLVVIANDVDPIEVGSLKLSFVVLILMDFCYLVVEIVLQVCILIVCINL